MDDVTVCSRKSVAKQHGVCAIVVIRPSSLCVDDANAFARDEQGEEVGSLSHPSSDC
jgi:hypothetical protein